MSELDEINEKLKRLDYKKGKLLKRKEELIEIYNELPIYLTSINQLLSFIGYRVEINKDEFGIVDIYDKDNNYYASSLVKDLLGFRFIGKDRKLVDIYSNQSTIDGSRFIIMNYNGYYLETCNSEKRLYDNYLEVAKLSRGQYIAEKGLIVGKNSLTASIRNPKNFSQRMFRLSDDNSFLMSEYSYSDNNRNDLLISGTTITISNWKDGINNRIEYNFERDIVEKLAFNAATHPRNKELAEYLMNEFDSLFPGIKDYINNNYPLYNKVMESEYSHEPLNIGIVERTINEECNLDNIQKTKRRLKK